MISQKDNFDPEVKLSFAFELNKTKPDPEAAPSRVQDGSLL
jgi:hypothetical protein